MSQVITVNCPCGNKQNFFSSKRIDPDTATSSFDINLRTVICFRELGLGHSAVENFSRHMNMPPPLTKFGYENIVNVVHPLDIKAAEESMTNSKHCW